MEHPQRVHGQCVKEQDGQSDNMYLFHTEPNHSVLVVSMRIIVVDTFVSDPLTSTTPVDALPRLLPAAEK